MAWRETIEDWTGRLNPYLGRVAIGLAMVVVLMAYQERRGAGMAPTPPVQTQAGVQDDVRPWRTD